MKSNPEPSPEQQNFEHALRRILQVSKTELLQRLEADKQAKAYLPKRGPKPKTSASGHKQLTFSCKRVQLDPSPAPAN